MARTKNSSGGRRGRPRNANGGRKNTIGGTSTCNGEENPAVGKSLSHSPGISLDWSQEEQSLLEDHLSKLSEEPIIVRYVKISQLLNDKTARDVALRCNWMNKKEMGKGKGKGKGKKNKETKENVTDPLPKASPLPNHSNGSPNAESMVSLDSDDGNPFDVIGGVAGQMLEQNQHAFEQISSNLSSCKISENLNLFRQARNNILSLLNECYSNDMPEMKAMPPIPVKLNDDLAKLILDQPQPMQFQPPNLFARRF